MVHTFLMRLLNLIKVQWPKILFLCKKKKNCVRKCVLSVTQMNYLFSNGNVWMELTPLDCPIEVFLLNGSVTSQVNIYGDRLCLEQ